MSLWANKHLVKCIAINIRRYTSECKVTLYPHDPSTLLVSQIFPLRQFEFILDLYCDATRDLTILISDTSDIWMRENLHLVATARRRRLTFIITDIHENGARALIDGVHLRNIRVSEFDFRWSYPMDSTIQTRILRMITVILPYMRNIARDEFGFVVESIEWEMKTVTAFLVYERKRGRVDTFLTGELIRHLFSFFTNIK